MNYQDQLQTLAIAAEQHIEKSSTMKALELLETRYLGRKGELTQLLRGLAEVPMEERTKIGTLANEVKQAIETQFVQKKQRLMEKNFATHMVSERIDVTEPGTRPPDGHLHLISQAILEITEIFNRMGFVRTRFPEVEWDWYAFEALNMPKDHPARDEWETFFMDVPESKKWGKMILTPHATSGTARILAQKQFPIRSINISKTYRRQMDMTHVPMFHQFDGVYVDKHVTVAHLLGILDRFAKKFFGETRRTRLRPFHFRFTEPSFEIDISCGVCDGNSLLKSGEKCRTCKRGWVELGGAGMLHPNVLKAARIDPSVYSGIAFGWGVERNYMMKTDIKIDDIRLLYKNDLRFLQQF